MHDIIYNINNTSRSKSETGVSSTLFLRKKFTYLLKFQLDFFLFSSLLFNIILREIL